MMRGTQVGGRRSTGERGEEKNGEEKRARRSERRAFWAGIGQKGRETGGGGERSSWDSPCSELNIRWG